MTPVETVPVTIDAEAAELVAELGMKSELECMLDQTRKIIPGLLRLHVAFGPPYDTGPDPAVLIEAYRDAATRQPDEQVQNQYGRWQTTSFSPDVFRHFVLLIIYENCPNAR
jgi:hypothetical protein